jgi:hypothetical protein
MGSDISGMGLIIMMITLIATVILNTLLSVYYVADSVYCSVFSFCCFGGSEG